MSQADEGWCEPVILSAAKNLCILLRVNSAKNLLPATRDRIKQMRRSPIAAPMNLLGTSESRNRTFVVPMQ
jgi:hypothetical protein